MATVSFNTHFPGYTVLGELGRGNARVLKARHDASGELVAIKHFALNTDEGTLQRFQQESEIMTRLIHPNIVRVREVRLDAALPYIVMELVEGGSVRQLLDENQTLPVATTVRLGLQVIEAFKVIHNQGVVHRDIKPENILYRQLPSGELHFLLTDFGIARLREQPATVTGQSLMTYEYASPEQFEDPKNVSAATDYYSLGVVLFECLNGHVPFAMTEGVGIVTFMNMVLTQAPNLDTTLERPLPISLANLLQGLLRKRASERIHQPDAVKVALKQAEIEQLLAEQNDVIPDATIAGIKTEAPAAQPIPVEPATPERRKTAPAPVAAPAAAPATEVTDPQTVTPRSGGINGRIILATVLATVLLVGAFVVYNELKKPAPGKSTATPARETTGLSSIFSSNEPETADSAAVDSVASRKPVRRDSTAAEKRAAAEALALEHRLENAKLAKLVSVQVVGFKTGLLGGISNLQVRLENPTKLTFTRIRVRISYIKESGDVFSTTNIYFANIGPYDELTRSAPDSRRGTSVRAKIIAYDSPDIPDLHPPAPTTDADSQF
ncbi:serine/threonine protein kinase [Fibrella sp. HMF5335]|uniref:Serine/threonine protein kinase n=1 Tax=Fibrella rubiginis TaxID=2817060 RepID=A0A939GAA4_9BACT|nr:serine/threonine-protein kinase [Fibrella rubiginis]MBO0935352.1 serine/threonine protein kinase [Fibrella rubiginis]